MRRILLCTGILGGGTALTFAAATLAATLLPGGTVVPAANVFAGAGMMKGGPVRVGPMAVPPPDVVDDAGTTPELGPTEAP